MKNLYYSILNILDEIIAYIEQKFKTIGGFRFIEFKNPKLFFHTYEKNFSIEAFLSLDAENKYWN